MRLTIRLGKGDTNVRAILRSTRFGRDEKVVEIEPGAEKATVIDIGEEQSLAIEKGKRVD